MNGHTSRWFSINADVSLGSMIGITPVTYFYQALYIIIFRLGMYLLLLAQLYLYRFDGIKLVPDQKIIYNQLWTMARHTVLFLPQLNNSALCYREETDSLYVNIAHLKWQRIISLWFLGLAISNNIQRNVYIKSISKSAARTSLHYITLEKKLQKTPLNILPSI